MLHQGKEAFNSIEKHLILPFDLRCTLQLLKTTRKNLICLKKYSLDQLVQRKTENQSQHLISTRFEAIDCCSPSDSDRFSRPTGVLYRHSIPFYTASLYRQ
jgi:hypothetical protein